MVEEYIPTLQSIMCDSNLVCKFKETTGLESALNPNEHHLVNTVMGMLWPLGEPKVGSFELNELFIIDLYNNNKACINSLMNKINPELLIFLRRRLQLNDQKCNLIDEKPQLMKMVLAGEWYFYASRKLSEFRDQNSAVTY